MAKSKKPNFDSLRGKRANQRVSVASKVKMPPKVSAKQAREFVDRAMVLNRMARFDLMQKAGLQYGGKRDVWETAGYEKNPQFDHYWSLYRRDAIGGRIVDMPAKTTWREAPTIMEEGKEETTFTKAFSELADQLNLWRYFARVDRLAGIGRYGILLIGTQGSQDMSQPVKKLSGGAKSIIYLQAYHENNAEIIEWDNEPSSPRFGQPKIYRIRFTSGVENFRPTGKNAEMRVHYSRVIHVAEDLLEDEVYGRPRLERPLNRLTDLDKISASTGESYWQAVVRILVANINPEATISEPDMQKLDERLLEVTHDLRRQVTGQGIDLKWLPTEVAPVKDIGDFYFSLIAAAVGIPQRILFGSEMGELASTTDQQTWFGLIGERQKQFAEPMILRAFIDRMIEFGVLPPPGDPDYLVQWPTLFKQTDSEIAELNLKRAQQAATLTPVGGDPRTMVTIDNEGTIELIQQTEEEANEREEELQQSLVPPEPPGGPDTGGQEPPPGEEDAAKPKDEEEDEEEDDAENRKQVAQVDRFAWGDDDVEFEEDE